MQWLRSRRRVLLTRLLPVLVAVWFALPMHACPIAVDTSSGDCPSHAMAVDAAPETAPCCDLGPTGVVPDLPLKSLHWDIAALDLLASGWIVRLLPESATPAAAHPPPTQTARPLHLTKRVLLI